VSVLRTMHKLGVELGAGGLGRLRLDISGYTNDDPQPGDDVDYAVNTGSHHIGTARMSADPRHGVVDANLKVHSVANLYVAGSAVFPTCGANPPTLTIVALALRLAEHLAAVVPGTTVVTPAGETPAADSGVATTKPVDGAQ
jgi:choline dehydrogenase-like flavoprotein